MKKTKVRINPDEEYEKRLNDQMQLNEFETVVVDIKNALSKKPIEKKNIEELLSVFVKSPVFCTVNGILDNGLIFSRNGGTDTNVLYDYEKSLGRITRIHMRCLDGKPIGDDEISFLQSFFGTVTTYSEMILTMDANSKVIAQNGEMLQLHMS